MMEKLICTGYVLMMTLIVGVCLFGNNIDYSGKTQTIFAEPLLLLCGILLIGMLAMILYGLLLFDTARQITNSRFAAWFSWILYLILVGASPWVSIPYSDSLGLIFLVAIFWCYVKMEKEESNKKWLYGGAIGLLTAIAYRIKPQISIVLIAISIEHVIHALKNLKQTEMEPRMPTM